MKYSRNFKFWKVGDYNPHQITGFSAKDALEQHLKCKVVYCSGRLKGTGERAVYISDSGQEYHVIEV